MTIDLSTNPEGPYVTRDGRKATYVPTPKPVEPSYPYAFDIEGERALQCYLVDGRFMGDLTERPLDLIPAPVEPEKRYLNWHLNGSVGLARDTFAEAYRARGGDTVTLELSVDEHGIPIDGSVVKRVEP